MTKRIPRDPAIERAKLDQATFKRRNQRRLDFRTLEGLIRESVGNYRDMRDGVVTLEAGDIYSRVIARHRELLVNQKQEADLAVLVQQLKELSVDGVRRFDPDLDDEPVQRLTLVKPTLVTK